MRILACYKLVLILCTLIIHIFSQDDTEFTNLFEMEDEKKLETEVKKRSSYSIMNSGNKIGIQIGYNYVLGDNPNMFTAFIVDIPFSRISSFGFGIGSETISLSSYNNTDTTNSTNAFSITNASGDAVACPDVSQGDGKLNYLTMTGAFKFYIGSIWFGPGISYHRFLDGYIQAKFDNSVYYLDYKIDNYTHDFYAILTVGYLAEIRPNVFLLPEARFSYNLIQDRTRMVASMTTGLVFRL